MILHYYSTIVCITHRHTHTHTLGQDAAARLYAMLRCYILLFSNTNSINYYMRYLESYSHKLYI